MFLFRNAPFNRGKKEKAKTNNNWSISKKIYFKFIIISFYILALIGFVYVNLNKRYKILQLSLNKKSKTEKPNKDKENSLKKNKSKYSFEKCYYSPDNSNLKIIHIIMTRFMINLTGIPIDIYPEKIYEKDYILNGIRVMKKYLFPSLENQSCKKFIFILMVGNEINKTYIKSLINLNNTFETQIIEQKYIKNYIRNITKSNDILITTRIDYDDRIYYDAVNDVRKSININKPMIVYGYNSGVHFYENENKYYEFYKNYNNKGVMSIFISLIIVLNKVNDIYTVYDLGGHTKIRNTILKSFKLYGINELNYEPAIFDSGEAKFVWVRHNFSGTLNYSWRVKRHLKAYSFNLTNFYGQ